MNFRMKKIKNFKLKIFPISNMKIGVRSYLKNLLRKFRLS